MTVESPRSTVQRSLPPDSAGHLPGRSASQLEATPNQSGPGAKQRVLMTADRLFYDEGIRTVGVDRLIAESSVTKATFYKHFGSKDNLVLDYINRRSLDARATIADLADTDGGAPATLRALVEAIGAGIQHEGFRGCPFVNAAAEFADPAHPVRVVVFHHREWYTETLVELFKKAGHPMPGDAADELYLARDGALVAGYTGDAIAAVAALTRVSDRLFADCAS